MKLTADWIESGPAQRVMSMFSKTGEEAYFVGGCVRNSLLGVPVSDLDIATSVRPERTVELAETFGFKAIPTGIDHGTITVVVEGEPFEITTFRKDVETDGRRAVIAFAETIEEDARRRDFTMNALYAKADGSIVDPLGGLSDLRARRVRFIDDPVQRIREDYLRILRFFRFHAWYGDDEAGLDPEGLAACATHIDGLARLSRERIGHEMIKLLSATAPERALGAMDQTGVLNALLPGASTKAFFILTSLEQTPDPILRLAALGEFDVAALLRLSKAQMGYYQTLRDAALGMRPAAEIAYREGETIARGAMTLRAAFLEQPVPERLSDDIRKGAEAKLPISARDLMAVLSGRELGGALKRLEQDWIDSGFQLSKEELLRRVGRG
ncbi:CCA tRNA nucleotidyltransferase [Celeribacter sp. SCSIO 80788]|uniref:CCA tRNA nucleotidyltransferase n=1 Tax=Celeribacter sp. SCSIO 80788 TaxID=3117013 RepID=UPI003DA26629